MENETISVDEKTTALENTKFCKFCGEKISSDAVICTFCGRQVEQLKVSAQQSAAAPNIVINNSNMNSNVNMNHMSGVSRRLKNKWVSLVLCIFLGFVGGHKFYEEKIGMGILYIFTMGLFGFGTLVDLITILLKPNPYYV